MQKVVLVAVVALLALSLTSPLYPSGGAHWLVWTEVPEAGAASLIVLDDVLVVSDQRDYLLSVVNEPGLERLEQMGIRTLVLDENPLAQDNYYVVRVSDPTFISSLDSLPVRMLHRDRTSAVLQADAEAAAEVSAAAHARGGIACGAVTKLFFYEIAASPRRFQPPQRSGIGSDPLIQGLVNQVSQAAIESAVNDLVAFGTRRYNQAGGFQAQNYLVSRYQSLSTPQNRLTVSTHDFDAGHDNVIAILPGTVNPEQYVVLGGHYDSINFSGQTAPAPGADDDASGTASVLEACRVLSQSGVRFEKSIVFAAWAAEEVGLVGSQAYVTQVVIPQGMDVRAMIQLDMDGYLMAGDARDVDFATNDTDPNLTSFVRQVLAMYVPGLPSVTGVLTAGTSDHRSFSQNGFPAVFPFEDLTDYSHFLHTSGDTVGQSFNEPTLARDFTKMVVAALAELAIPLDGLRLSHTPLGDTSDPTACRSVTARAVSVDPVTSVELFWRNSDANVVRVALAPTPNAGEYSATIPANPVGMPVSYHLRAMDTTGRVQTLPAGAPASEFTYVTRGVERLFFDDFETAGDNGWAHGGTQDDWHHGPPDQASNNSYDPDRAFSGAKVWGNDLSPAGFNGNYANNANNFLQSPTIAVAGRSGIHLRYRRHLSVEDGVYDTARIRANGLQVWRNPVGGGTNHLIDTSWILHDVDLSTVLAGQPLLVLRFELVSDGGLTFGGWNLDDVAIEADAPGPSITVDDATPSIGQTIRFLLSAPGHGGEDYTLVLAVDTAPGTSLNPGSPGDCRIVPYTPGNQHEQIRARRASAFTAFSGTLDASGTSNAPRIDIPNAPRARGRTVRFTGWLSNGATGTAAFPIETIQIQ